MSFSDGVLLELCFKLVRANEWKLKVHEFSLMAASTSQEPHYLGVGVGVGVSTGVGVGVGVGLGVSVGACVSECVIACVRDCFEKAWAMPEFGDQT